MGCAIYIGRVGALAVALGVGAAVAIGYGIGTPTVAWADEGNESSENTPNYPTAPNDPSGPSDPTGVQDAGSGSGAGPGSVSGNAPTAPDMQLSVSGNAQISGQDVPQGNGPGSSTATPEITASTPTQTVTPSPTVTPSQTVTPPTGPASIEVPPEAGAVVPPATGTTTTTPTITTVIPNGNDPVGQKLFAPVGGSTFRVNTFSLASDPGQPTLLAAAAAAAVAADAPAPAPLVDQPENLFEALLATPIVLANIAITAVSTFLSSIFAPGPTIPAPPVMLFVVLGWVQRELQRTFFNQSPTGVADAVTTSEDVAKTFSVLGNDTDGDLGAGDVLTITDYTQPAHGAVLLNSNGTFTYTPTANFSGTDTFTYTVSDEASPWHTHGLAGYFFGGGHSSTTTTVPVTVTPVPDAPVAVNDTYTVDEDRTLIVGATGVLVNDSDADADAMTAALTVGPAHGTLSLIATGAFTYTPAANYHGTDTFTYRTFDGTLNSNTATVTINVTSVNDAPIANPDTYTTAEDTPLTVAIPNGVMGNDSDPDDDAALTATVITPPTHGVLNFDSNGAFTYTPAANYHGTDTFTYRTFDGTLNSNTATVTINVTSVNDAPIANPDTYTTAEDTPLTVAIPNGVMGNDSDPDDDAALTATVITPPTHGVLNFDSNGAFTYTPAANYHGTDTFTYRTFDGTLNSNTATVTINVTSVNDAPIANPDTYTTAEDTPLTVAIPNGVMGNDSDPDDDAALTATVITPPTHGVLNFDSNGAFTYTPAANYHGTDTFTYRTFDGTLNSNTATVTINVTSVNDAPIAADDAYTVGAGRALTVTAAGVLTNDTDVDSGAVLTATVVQGPAHGTMALSADGTFTYTPSSGFSGTDFFIYTVSDNTNLTDTGVVTIAVTPITASDDAFTVLMDTSTVLSPALGANDTSVTGLEMGAITIVDAPTHGSVQVNPDGTVTYRPYNDYRGTDTFTYTVEDGNGLGIVSNTATVTVTVISPIIATDDTYTVLMNGPTVLSPGLAANDTRYPGTNFDLGAITIVTAPTHGTVTQAADGTVTYRPFNGYRGTDTFTYTLGAASPGIPASNTATVTVTVISPIIANDDAYTVLMNGPTVLSPGLAANDTRYPGTNFDLGAITIVDATTHGSVQVNPDGTVTYRPYNDYRGTDTFTYTLAAANTFIPTSNTATVTVTVISPIIATDDTYTVLMDTPTVLSPAPSANDNTYPGTRFDLGAITVVDAPTHGTVTQAADGTVTYRPFNDFRGTDTFTYTLGAANTFIPASNTATVTLTVISPIIAADDAYTVLMDTPTVLSPALSANDTRYPGTNFDLGAITIVTAPTHGMISQTGNTVTYRPDNGYRGTDTFTYTLGATNTFIPASNTATVTLTVISPIIAADDAYTVLMDTPTVLSPALSANDTRYPGTNFDLGAITIVTAPTHGMISQTGNTVTYRPDNGYRGTDTFTYTLGATSPGIPTSNTATVTLTVISPIIAADDAYTVLMDTPTVLSPALAANDTRYPGTNFDLGAITIVTAPTHGTVTQAADGTVTYRPFNGYRGTDTFTYTLGAASPGIPASNTATVTVTVISPIIAADDAYTVLMDTPTVLSPALAANDTRYPGTNFDLGAITIVTAPTHGTVTQAADGTVTYRPFNGYRGTDTFTYTLGAASPGIPASNTATVTVTVISPIIATDDTYTVLMNGPTVLSPGLAANDTRYPGTNVDLGAITIVTAPTHGSVQVNPDGTVTYRPYNDYRGTDTFTYTLGAASPGIPASNTATVTVTVISPIIATDDAYTVLMNGPTVLSPGLAANDTRYPGTNFDLGNITIVTAPTHGSATANPDGTVTYGPFNGYRGTDTFTYTLGATNTFIPASNTATVTVTVVPQLPAAVNDTATVAEDSTANTITVLANDDVIYAGFKPVRAVSDPAHGAALVTADGATIIYTPDPNFDGGIDTFTYTLDGGSTATVTVYVTPNMITTTVGRPDANGTVTGTALLNNPVPGFVGYAITGAPTQGYVTVNADTGVFTYTPTNASRLAATAITTDTFTITASDVPRTAAEIVAVPVSPAAFTFTGTITVGPSPAAVAVSPAGTQLYFADTGGSVSVFDRATNTVTDTIPVGSNPVDMAISPNGRFLYVANQGSASVSVIDTATNALTRTITVGSIPTSVAVSPDGTRVYVANQGSASVSVIDTTINTVAATIAVGSGPMAVAVTPDGQRLYVANSNSNTVSVIDTATDTITHTIAVGGSPDAVAVSPDGQRVYVANRTSGSVSVINTATNTVTRTIAVENLPGAMAITPDGKRVYVANYASRSVSVIDTATDTVTDTIRAWSGPVSPVAVEVAPSGTLLYIIDTSGSVLVIDTDNNTFAGTPIPVGSSPVSAAVSPSSATVYVVNNGSNTVSVIDTTTITVTNTIAVGGSPNAVAASPDGQRVYVANRTSGSVSVINTTTDTVTHTIPVGTLPAAVVVSPDGMQLYVANSYSPFANSLSETVLVIDTATNTVTGSVSVGSPGGLAVSPDGKLLYVTNFDDDTVSVIDTRTSTILDTITVGTFPTELAVSPDGGRLYVINQLGYTVSVIDTTTATVTVTIPVGSTRVAVAVSPDGSLLYVTSFDDDTVSVIDTATNSVIRVIPVGSRPAAVAVNADGTQVFVANQSSNTVSVISLT